jgi:hypothetical protein
LLVTAENKANKTANLFCGTTGRVFLSHKRLAIANGMAVLCSFFDSRKDDAHLWLRSYFFRLLQEHLQSLIFKGFLLYDLLLLLQHNLAIYSWTVQSTGLVRLALIQRRHGGTITVAGDAGNPANHEIYSLLFRPVPQRRETKFCSFKLSSDAKILILYECDSSSNGGIRHIMLF